MFQPLSVYCLLLFSSSWSGGSSSSARCNWRTPIRVGLYLFRCLPPRFFSNVFQCAVLWSDALSTLVMQLSRLSSLQEVWIPAAAKKIPSSAAVIAALLLPPPFFLPARVLYTCHSVSKYTRGRTRVDRIRDRTRVYRTQFKSSRLAYKAFRERRPGTLLIGHMYTVGYPL